jgi:hypothetical protein
MDNKKIFDILRGNNINIDPGLEPHLYHCRKVDYEKARAILILNNISVKDLSSMQTLQINNTIIKFDITFRTRYWAASASNDFNDPANWSPVEAPDSSDDVVFKYDVY